jgi:hypothetical protein
MFKILIPSLPTATFSHLSVFYARGGVTYRATIRNGGRNEIELALLAKKIGRGEVTRVEGVKIRPA